MMMSAPRPVKEPPTGIVMRPPPLVVTHSVSVSLASRTFRRQFSIPVAPYHDPELTGEEWRQALVSKETQAKRLLGSWPSDQATNATDVQIDLSERGGWVTMSLRVSPACTCQQRIDDRVDVPVVKV